VLDFNAAVPEFLECPAASTVDLDFTIVDFSLAIWVYVNDFSANRALFFRGEANAIMMAKRWIAASQVTNHSFVEWPA